jgi:hypothetical protein
MSAVHRHYDRVSRETTPVPPDSLQTGFHPPLVIAPLETWNSVSENALRLALTLSPDVHVVHVESEDVEQLDHGAWQHQMELLARVARRPMPELVVLKPPYRYVIQPILDYVLTVERENPDRMIAVVIAELVARKWYHYFLHNQRGKVLSALLLLRGAHRIAIVNLPWYLKG